jgi:MSHA biogenesis protein MshN
MSLINQMLKDLDKRGSGAAGSNTPSGTIRAVPERSGSNRLLISVILLLVVLGGAALWFFWGQIASLVATSTSSHRPAKSEPAQHRPSIREISPAIQSATSINAAEAKPAPAAVHPTVRQEKLGPTAKSRHAQPEARQDKTPLAIPSSQRLAPAAAAGQGKEVTSLQLADNAYGKAASLIGTGHKTEAIAALENVLTLNPAHAAARQTLVGLLLDGKRSDEAARKLEEGLKLDPAQSGMAMVLARIQVEKNDTKTALATLQRTLPFSAQKPDYLAFMAALLQREKRHKEASSLYLQALNKAPQNGHWWMGYAISLKADNRLADARQAFVRAKESNKLSPELMAFVEQEISKLGGV